MNLKFVRKLKKNYPYAILGEQWISRIPCRAVLQPVEASKKLTTMVNLCVSKIVTSNGTGPKQSIKLCFGFRYGYTTPQFGGRQGYVIVLKTAKRKKTK